MTVLGIDPSTTSVGYAVYRDGVAIGDGYFEPDRTSPRHTLESIEQRVRQLLEEFAPVKLVACEQMFVSRFQGNIAALLNVVPLQISYVCNELGITSMRIPNSVVKKTVGANLLLKKNKKMKTKEAVYACVVDKMSAEARALPKEHRFDVSDAHAIALTAMMHAPG